MDYYGAQQEAGNRQSKVNSVNVLEGTKADEEVEERTRNVLMCFAPAELCALNRALCPFFGVHLARRR